MSVPAMADLGPAQRHTPMPFDYPPTVPPLGDLNRTTAQSSLPEHPHLAGFRAPVELIVLMVAAGGLGLWAAFQLTLDKMVVLANPDADLSCNFSVLVGCSANRTSRQGSLFGFPNPLIGIVGWTIVITTAVILAAKTSLTRWFWLALNAGLVAASALVGFLIVQSIYVLNVLCPYCMLTWAVTIPLFWAITLYNLKSGHMPAPHTIRRIAAIGYDFVLLITVACYLLIAALAQMELDWVNRIA